MTDYYKKYLKYKTKYLELKSNDMVGGGKNNYGLAQYDFNTNDFNYSGKKISNKSIFQCASLSKQVFTIIIIKIIINLKT